MPPKTAPKKAKSKQSTLVFSSQKPPSEGSSRSVPMTKILQPLTAPLSNSKGKQKVKEPEFLLPARSKSLSEAPLEVGEDTLWAERYAPKSREDLAVHKQKIEQVSHWLSEAFGLSNDGRLQKYRRILALTGPSGVGKSTTIRVLLQNLGIQIIEWRNALDDWKMGDMDDVSDEKLSLSRKFDHFLSRSNTYSSLSFASTSATPVLPHKRLILIEDIPNIQNLTVKEAFHAALQRFIETSNELTCPLAIVISDAGTRAEGATSEGNSNWRTRQMDTVDFRTVFPKDLQNSPLVAQIQFNPIAATLLRKGVSRVIVQHFGAKESPLPKEFVDSVLASTNGDIRSAISTLQFAHRGDLGPPPNSRKKGDKVKRETISRALVESVSQREQSLHLFHLLGKLMYNKRYGDDPKEDEDDPVPPILHDLPPHLNNQKRKPSKVKLAAMYDESPIDSSLIALYVHQNYTLFCEEAENCELVCNWLSLSDQFLGADTIHNSLSEYAFYVAAAGTLQSLPTPVARKNQKFVKPEFFESLKKARTAEDQVDETRAWLARCAGSSYHSKHTIGVELGAALLSSLGASIPEHDAYTSFPDSQPPRKLDGDLELDLDNDDLYASTQVGAVAVLEEEMEGWLSDDAIEEF